MADLDVTKKLHVYHVLYRLNLSFAAIVRRCQTLEKFHILQPKFLRLYQGLAQELQAEINEDLLERLHEIELDDRYRFGKVRLAREKELRDPDDVFFHARSASNSCADRRKGCLPARNLCLTGRRTNNKI